MLCMEKEWGDKTGEQTNKVSVFVILNFTLKATVHLESSILLTCLA